MKVRSLAFIAVLLLVVGVNAHAQCPTAPTSYGAPPGGQPFVVWTQDAGCYSLGPGISGTTVNCFSGAGWSFTSTSTSVAAASFTAYYPYVLNASGWSAGSFVEFNSPTSSANDEIDILAVVWSGGSPTTYNLFHWDGTMGTLSGCAEQYGTFTANVGDAVDIRIHARNGSGGATIKASYPRIFNQ